MKTKDSLLSVFLLMLIFIVILYGFYELGGCYMSKCECFVNWVVFIILALILFLVGILGWKCIFCEKKCSCDMNILYVSEGKFYLNSTELEDVYIISKKSNVVPKDNKNVFVVNDITLENTMFEDLGKIENIYILSTKPTITADLFEKIKDKIKYISSDKQILQIVFVDSKNNK